MPLNTESWPQEKELNPLAMVRKYSYPCDDAVFPAVNRLSDLPLQGVLKRA